MRHNPLRLLVVGIAWPPETFLRRLLDGLSARGVEITAATSTRPDHEWLKQPNHRWLRTPQWNGPYLARLLRLSGLVASNIGHLPRGWLSSTGTDRLAALNRLLPFAHPHHWDIIYFPWNSAAVEYLPLFDLGIPTVISCRGAQINIAPHNPARAALREGLKTSFDRAAAIHCVSEDILNQALLLGLDPRKARIIRPAVDPDFFTPANAHSPDDIFRIITTGSLIWRKGFEYALMTLKILCEMDIPVHFEIIGSGPEKDRILFTIRDLGLDKHVHLAGQLPPAGVRERLHSADAFLLSSLSEGISNAALEAMSCGLPVVSTDCGGMREAIMDGVDGWLVPVRDPAALADRLKRLHCDPQRAHIMGQNARERILQNFRLEQQVSAFVDLFHQAANRS